VSHLISSAEKFTIVGMKFSRIMMERICFQSVVLSPSSRQMDSRASLTAAGGLAIEKSEDRKRLAQRKDHRTPLANTHKTELKAERREGNIH
uniref:Uncharacterized protein n=1 Tax=Sinocyclocheilus anshuiensis TaxID=1608454 RepID=A0A671RY39_9TELE